jgi:tRNA(Ile)-lysidine synthase
MAVITPPELRETGAAGGRDGPSPPRESAPVTAVHEALGAALTAHSRPRDRLAVALSGGIDSMVLLDALDALAPRFDLQLSALHVDHRLSPNAGRWAAFCADACAARGVPLTIHRVDVARRAGQSLEAAARAARYQKLLGAEVDMVALAHHADDQAETVLLQLLRGAGPAGLAAMPVHRAPKAAGPSLLRPLLELPRSTLAAYAKSRGLAWIDDESNADRRYRRNLLRLAVAPLLAQAFPGYPSVIVRAAGHQSEASALLDELAHQDAGDVEAGLQRAALRALSPARARNLLRWYLREIGLRPPSAARLAEMLAQLRTAAADARTRIVHDGAEIGCYRGRVVAHAADAGQFARTWRGEDSVALPGGTLRFERTHGSGIAAAKLAAAPVMLRSRQGGERIQLAANRPRRAVKKLLYDAQLPGWQRGALPFIWCGDELVAVPGIGIALAFQGLPGEATWRVEWCPAP